MLDPVKILKRSWHILWSYRALWVFGLILALAAGSASSHGSNNSNYRQDQGHTQQLTPHDMQQGFQEFKQELNKIFEQGIPEADITGQALTTFLWVIGAFVLIMILVGIVMAVARYVSETAVIRMVDDYETSSNKMTVRQGIRIGWSKTAWRLFLINLIVNLPAIALALVLLIAGIGVYFAWVNGTANFAAFSTVATIVLAFITIFVVVILSIVLHLLRNFFWRVSVLEDAGVRESFRRGFAFVLENWKSVGLMWLVMIGLGIVWAVASVILIIVSIPIVIITAVIALLVVAIPFLLFDGPLFRVIDTHWWGTLLIYMAAVLTIWSMVYYLQKALPEIRAKAR